ncbi:hypothetical protein [Mesorhizobium marinum]|uniref:hypothetical protein n=1 Tax=Mesorhizobium marinum TaxID=3228790 RepID=UPI003467D0CB
MPDTNVSLREKRLQKLRRVIATLAAAKASGDRYSAAECYQELTAFEIHAETASMRREARQLIDHAELDWFRAEEELATLWIDWLNRQISSYAKAEPSGQRREQILAKVRDFAEHSATPQFARREASIFLAAPEAWTAGWKKSKGRRNG